VQPVFEQVQSQAQRVVDASVSQAKKSVDQAKKVVTRS
jgi:hypothetical protein